MATPINGALGAHLAGAGPARECIAENGTDRPGGLAEMPQPTSHELKGKNMNLTKLLSLSRKEQTEVVNAIDPAQVKGRAMKRQLAKMKKKEGGFTLLELLVVVGIIAAIAGTATILLRDTDRQAMAAAHVAMMDELMKGVETYKKLNDESFPTNFDSLMRNTTNTLVAATSVGAVTTDVLNEDLAASLADITLTAAQAALLKESGIDSVRILAANDPNGTTAGDCSATGIKDLIKHKGNNITAATVFRVPTANGCGYAADYAIDDAIATQVLQRWAVAGNERVNAGAADVLVALGLGPDTSLFNPANRGAMTTVPVYRHVSNDEYNRFIALFNVDEAVGEVRLQAIIDGAGDTKDEELGEWDNTRPT